MRDLLLFTDIPTLQRQRMIKAIEDTYPPPLDEARKVRARLKHQSNGPKYEVFFSFKPLVQFVSKSAARVQILSKGELTHITVAAI